MCSAVPDSLRLDLDQVVRDYVHNLNVMLRGFKAVEGCDFLETFVPSEDPATSVRDLVELSREAGVQRLSISMSARTAGHLDRAQLAQDVGDFSVATNADGIELVFTRTAVPAESLDDIHPAYRCRLAEVLIAPGHEQPVPETGAGLVVTAEQAGIRLWAIVDPTTHFIRQAGFLSVDGPVSRGLLEATCLILEGTPVIESSDHAVIRLEAFLRDEASPPPVRGTILPQNAGKPFLIIQQLVRDLAARYRAESGSTDDSNFYDPPVADSWLRSSTDRKLETARSALGSAAGDGRLEIVRLDGLRRLVVRFADDLRDLGLQQSLLVRAENHLRKTLHTPLQIVLETRADKNSIRHLDPRK